MTIIAAADGSALGNPGPAGWAWYIDDDTWAAGGWDKSTNNRGELTAVAELLAATAHLPEEKLLILCDSQYVINSVTKWMPGWKRKGWKKRDGKPVLNVDILSRIDELMQGRDVEFEWVRGHTGHEMNEAADERARGAAIAHQKGEAPNEGPGFPGAGAAPGAAAESAAGSARTTSRTSTGANSAGVASAASQSAPGGAAGSSPQSGLFDVAPDPAAVAAERVRLAHVTLSRAAAKAHKGDDARLRFLAKRAAVVPAEFEVAFPADFGSPRPDVTVVGSVGVAVTRGGAWTAVSTWDIAGDPVLASHHLSPNT